MFNFTVNVYDIDKTNWLFDRTPVYHNFIENKSILGWDDKNDVLRKYHGRSPIEALSAKTTQVHFVSFEKIEKKLCLSECDK